MKNPLVIVFIVAFCWMMFLTYGMPFIWEDIIYLHLDKAEYPVIESQAKIPLILQTAARYVREFFVGRRLFQIGFCSTSILDRPYQYLTFDFFGTLFGDRILLYKIVKALVFSISACCVFAIVRRASYLLAFIGTLLYISYGEIWLTMVCLHEVTPYTQCAVFLSVLLFLKLLEKHTVLKKDLLFYYILIFVVSNYAVLSKGDGRYLALVFLITLLVFRRGEIVNHLFFLIPILFTELPVLGYVKKIFTGHPVSPIDCSTHSPLPLGAALDSIFKNLKFVIPVFGSVLLVILTALVCINIFYLIARRSGFFSKKLSKTDTDMKETLFLVTLWFFIVFSGTAMSRCFGYGDYLDWSMGECSHFIGPFIIFLCFYISFIHRRIAKPYKTAFLAVIAVLMVAQFVFGKVPRMNAIRGVWGNYFCAWHNAEKYIDRTADNALVLAITTPMQYKPFVFRGSGNKVINNVFVSKKYLSGVVHDTDGLFSSMVKNGYIDESGVIQDKFRGIRNENDMALPQAFDKSRKEIFNIVRRPGVMSVDQTPFRDLGYLESKFRQAGVKDIFVAARGEIEFTGRSQSVVLIGTKVMDGDSGDLYDRLKRLIRRPSKPMIWVYHFRYDTTQSKNYAR